MILLPVPKSVIWLNEKLEMTQNIQIKAQDDFSAKGIYKLKTVLKEQGYVLSDNQGIIISYHNNNSLVKEQYKLSIN
jgi:hypothetical protein